MRLLSSHCINAVSGISIAPIIYTVPVSILLQAETCLGVGISHLLSLKIVFGTKCFLLLSSSAVSDCFMGGLHELQKTQWEESGRGRNFVLCVSPLTPSYLEVPF